MRRALVLAVLAAEPAHAGDGIPLSVEVGRSVERRVDNAIGWFCDDPSLVEATITTRAGLNYWTVTGVKVGTTPCRVGTDPSRATFVFEVSVKPVRNRRR